MEHFWREVHDKMFNECCADYYIQKITDIKPEGKICEIGVFTGASLSILIVENINQNKMLDIVAIDPWADSWYKGPTSFASHDGEAVFQVFMRKFFEKQVPDRSFRYYRDFSFNAAKQEPDASFDFVFIDGGHEHNEVKRDIVDWLPKVKPGGILAGHDLQYAPVKLAVTELLPNFSQKCEHIWEVVV